MCRSRLSQQLRSPAARTLVGAVAGLVMAAAALSFPLIYLALGWDTADGVPTMNVLAALLGLGAVAGSMGLTERYSRWAGAAAAGTGVLLFLSLLGYPHILLEVRGEPARVQVTGSERYSGALPAAGHSCHYQLRREDSTRMLQPLVIHGQHDDCVTGPYRPGTWTTVYADREDRVSPLPGEPRLTWPLVAGGVLALGVAGSTAMAARAGRGEG